MLKFLADGLLLAVLGVAACVVVYWVIRNKPRLKIVVPYVAMAGLTSLLVGKLMSFWQPETLRPFIKQGVEAGAAYIDNPGFPSDHALLAVVVVMTIYMLTPYKKLSYVLMTLVVIMCAARVVALVHTPLDVVGGIVAGLVGCVWYLRLRQTYPQA